jgi:hypothetical protein
MDKIVESIYERLKREIEIVMPEYNLELKQTGEKSWRIGDNLEKIDDHYFRHGGTRHTRLLISIHHIKAFMYGVSVYKNEQIMPERSLLINAAKETRDEHPFDGFINIVAGEKAENHTFICGNEKYLERCRFLRSIPKIDPYLGPHGQSLWRYNNFVHLYILMKKDDFAIADAKTRSEISFQPGQFTLLQDEIDQMTEKMISYDQTLMETLYTLVPKEYFKKHTRSISMFGKEYIEHLSICINEEKLVYAFQERQQVTYADTIEELDQKIREHTISFYKRNRLKSLFK